MLQAWQTHHALHAPISGLVKHLKPGPSSWRAYSSLTSQYGISEEQIERMRAFMDLLLSKNKVMNLTAVADGPQAWDRHVLDSLAVVPIIDDHLGTRNITAAPKVIDVGSGAGLPGMIIALARPSWSVTLLDSTNKRCKFVEEVIGTLNVPNVTPVWSRAELCGQQPLHREVYSIALARAVAEMRILVELTLPLLQHGGALVAQKGPKLKAEAEVEQAGPAIEELGGRLMDIIEYDTTEANGLRTIVLVEKIKPTPSKYPRKEGRPQKRPL